MYNSRLSTENKPRPVLGIFLGVLINIVVGLTITGLVGYVFGELYSYFSGASEKELLLLLESNDELLSLTAFIITAIVAMLSGYVCSKYSKNRVYLYSLIMWSPFLIISLWLYNILWEQIFIIASTLVAVLIGTYIEQRKK